jgi:hypothetical protein
VADVPRQPRSRDPRRQWQRHDDARAGPVHAGLLHLEPGRTDARHEGHVPASGGARRRARRHCPTEPQADVVITAKDYGFELSQRSRPAPTRFGSERRAAAAR